MQPFTVIFMSVDREKFLKKLGAAVKKHRQVLGISQEQFANKYEIGRAYYGNIEQGRVNVSIFKLHQICQHLEIDISTLFQDIK